jgi:hypothetical protein
MMTPHLDIRSVGRVLACGAAGVLLVTGTVTTAAAAGTSHAANSHAKERQYCRDFVRHLSGDLNISNDRVQSAMARAARATVDDAVSRGDLTRSQGDAIKAHIGEQNVCAMPSRAAGGAGGHTR